MKKKNTLLLLLFSVSILLCIIVYINFYFVFLVKNKNESIGIIDGNLSFTQSNIVYNGNINNIESDKTHGDNLIDFLNDISYKGKIFYYSAIDKNNRISTDKIIEGLDWMYENNIKKVNISLSSKVYYETLQSWINQHNDVQIYSSYNNKLNSQDYPSMYKYVIASGTNNKIPFKSIDVQYRSNRIIVFNKGFYYYEGNSYLSLITMIR